MAYNCTSPKANYRNSYYRVKKPLFLKLWKCNHEQLFTTIGDEKLTDSPPGKSSLSISWGNLHVVPVEKHAQLQPT